MKPLDKKTIQWWRSISEHPEFENGILWLRVNASSSLRGDNEGSLLKSAIAFGGYQQALTDIETTLTTLQKKEVSYEEPSLNQ